MMKRKRDTACGKKKMPVASCIILLVIVLGCVFADVICKKDPSYLDLMNYTKAPNAEFWFGTDTLGRDIFSCIWHGGRVSLLIGVASTALSTVIAIVYGAISGIAGEKVDTVADAFYGDYFKHPESVADYFPAGHYGKGNDRLDIHCHRTDKLVWNCKNYPYRVRQLRSSEYVIAAKCMGGSFWHILWKHLAPNFVSSIMFMVVMNVRSAIVAESTLSFLGIGLPLDVISWGSMLSLQEKALMSRAVDRSDSGNFSGGRIDVYYQSGALASGESQSSGSKIITPSICDGKRMIEILQ